MKRFLPLLVWLLYGVGLGLIQYPRALFWWGLGFGIAGLLILGDRLLYIWWLKPFEQLSIQFQYWWKQRQFTSAFRLLLERRGEQTKLVLRSLGFALLWPLVTVYVFTSTGSITAAGIVMALGFRLVMAIVTDWGNPSALSRWFCWQIKRNVSIRELRIMTGMYVGAWVVVVGLLILK